MGMSTDALLVYGYHLGGDDAGWLVHGAGEYGELPPLDWYDAEAHDGVADVDAVLAYNGYEPSEYDPQTGWAPGYRIVQAGRRQVNVFHDGPGEQDGLERYALELQAAGFHVVPDQQPGGDRRRLHITKP